MTSELKEKYFPKLLKLRRQTHKICLSCGVPAEEYDHTTCNICLNKNWVWSSNIVPLIIKTKNSKL